MNRMLMPEAVRLVASEAEWKEFAIWKAQPKPIVLDRDGRCPTLPHDLADELFGRLISQLKNGEKSAIGFRENQLEANDIPAVFWSTHWYNIWFNTLVDLGRGTIAFGSICVGDPIQPVSIIPVPTLRAAMRSEVNSWVDANPAVQIRKKDLRKAVLAKLSERFPGNSFSGNMFDQLWQSVPPANKFSSNPAWVGGKGGEKN